MCEALIGIAGRGFRQVSIAYDHSKNLHSLTGPRAALPVFLAGRQVASLLDVGCGTGTWLSAALALGVREVLGIDGVKNAPEDLHVSPQLVRHQDLTISWDLARKFDAVICLEVAEHLDRAFAPTLVDALVKHGNWIVFSAASPGQLGQHHVNCQWPAYWQELFNQRGYACSDAIRWQVWDNDAVEPWYRQNVFVALRAPQKAGAEPRIPAVVHPEILPWYRFEDAGGSIDRIACRVRDGGLPVVWYLRVLFRAILAKLERRLNRQCQRFH